MEKQPKPNAHDIIYGRRDVSVKVRDSAWFLFEHELRKAPQCEEPVLVAVLAWIDDQHLLEARRRLEPTLLERQLLHMLIREGLTMKQIALKTGKRVGTTKQHFNRMRTRLGNLTLYQLVALSVEQGWIRMQVSEGQMHKGAEK